MGANGHATGRRIGDILVDLGYATPEQIDQALESKEDAYARLGLRLLRKGTINEVQLALRREPAAGSRLHRIGRPFRDAAGGDCRGARTASRAATR